MDIYSRADAIEALSNDCFDSEAGIDAETCSKFVSLVEDVVADTTVSIINVQDKLRVLALLSDGCVGDRETRLISSLVEVVGKLMGKLPANTSIAITTDVA